MSRGVNKVILIGNLGNDPDVKVTQNGVAVANLSIATDESYKDKQSGQVVPKTEWHHVVVFDRLAEVARDYLKKGSKVYIEGKLETRKWQDQSGADRYTTEIRCFSLQMLDSKPSDQVANGGQGSYANQPQQNQQQSNPRNFQAPADFDDDIPF